MTTTTNTAASSVASSNSGNSSRSSRNTGKQRFFKAPARPVAITIAAGATITCAVANIANHPESGVVVTIEGNPNGFIPNRLLAGKNPAAKEERRNHLLANPGAVLEVFVDTAAMAAPKATKSTTEASDNSESAKPSVKLRPRIILNEDKIVVGKIIRARQEANAKLRDQVAALEIGACMQASVLSFATKKNDNDDGRHVIGAFVALANGLSALLHKSQMFNIHDLSIGATIYVAIRSAEMDGNRAKVSVKQVPIELVDPTPASSAQAATPPTSGRSASQAMWDQVAEMLNEPGGATQIVIDPSV